MPAARYHDATECRASQVRIAAIARDRPAARDALRHISHLDQWPNTEGNAKSYVNVLPWLMQRD